LKSGCKRKLCEPWEYSAMFPFMSFFYTPKTVLVLAFLLVILHYIWGGYGPRATTLGVAQKTLHSIFNFS
jgi:hypothetical protein